MEEEEVKYCIVHLVPERNVRYWTSERENLLSGGKQVPHWIAPLVLSLLFLTLPTHRRATGVSVNCAAKQRR